MFKKIKSAFGFTAANKVITKEAEYNLYEKVSQDIANGERDEGVWTSAFAKSEGDNQKAEAKYIDLMVQRYKDLIDAGIELAEILQTAAEREEIERKQRLEEEAADKMKREWEEEYKRTQEEIANESSFFNPFFILGLALPIFFIFIALFNGWS